MRHHHVVQLWVWVAKPASNGFCQNMSCTLPPEILDLIIDHLHDEPATLKTCCVVSKSWVPRTRKHLFAHVEFHYSKSPFELWKKAFPDPSNSPAHHTYSLLVDERPIAFSVDAGAVDWIRTFRNVEYLRFSFASRATLVPFYGMLPVVRSLHMRHSTVDVFDLICSFPLLENLWLDVLYPEVDGWNTPSTSPKLTGSLYLRTRGCTDHVIRRLLDLPGGLHFSMVNVKFFDDEAESIGDLVARCSDTLESLTVLYCPPGVFPSAPVTGLYLTAVRGRRHT